MKPVRGSERDPSKAPGQKNTKKTAKKQTATKSPDRTHGEQKLEEALIRKAPQKRKAGGGSSSDVKENKVKANWKPMSASSIADLENILDLSILATLSVRSKAKQEHQEHLNIIKKRFIDECKQLRVPVQKQKQHSHQHHQEERKKSAVGKKTLRTLEKDLTAAVTALEKMEEQAVSLQDKYCLLRSQIEEEEEKAKQILQITEQDVLNIPLYPSPKDETTLETRLKEMMSDRDCETTAKKLARILQTSDRSPGAQVLLQQAQEYANQLFGDFRSHPV